MGGGGEVVLISFHTTGHSVFLMAILPAQVEKYGRLQFSFLRLSVNSESAKERTPSTSFHIYLKSGDWEKAEIILLSYFSLGLSHPQALISQSQLI
jgi:hypothetical protein